MVTCGRRWFRSLVFSSDLLSVLRADLGVGLPAVLTQPLLPVGASRSTAQSQGLRAWLCPPAEAQAPVLRATELVLSQAAETLGGRPSCLHRNSHGWAVPGG